MLASDTAEHPLTLLPSTPSTKQQICPEPQRQDVAHVPPFRLTLRRSSPVP